ncbi:MAG: glycosyltransferase, partial [Blastocatellia bacterium]|nr:glycosyltransferase [Blastocatellia bacterium]
FALAHRTNDFGRAFFDAMAAGSPVVAFRTEASSNTVRDGVDGLLSPMDDVESFAATIKRFHDDRPFLIRVANEARKRALENTRTFWFNLRAGWTKELFQN